MVEDSVVEEIRSIRAAHAAKFGYDLDAIFQDLKRCESQSGRDYVSYPPKRLYAAADSAPRCEALGEPTPDKDPEA
jgi:hypothetical protein